MLSRLVFQEIYKIICAIDNCKFNYSYYWISPADSLVIFLKFFMRMQFLTQVFGVSFAGLMLLCRRKFGKPCEILMATKKGHIIQAVSSSSLEIHLIQFAIIEYLKEVPFPLNLLLIVVFVIIVGVGIHWMIGKTINFILSRSTIKSKCY